MSMFDPLINLLREAGYELGLDVDDTVLIGHPDEIDPVKLGHFVGEKYTESIRFALKREAERVRRRLHGGPFAGERRDPETDYYGRERFTFGIKVERGKWAVYERWRDGRAFFRGWATSEKKAKAGQYEPAGKDGGTK